MEATWKRYGIGQLDSVLLQLHGRAKRGEPSPTSAELADLLGISVPNLRGAVKVLTKGGWVEVDGHRKTGKRGADSQTLAATERGAARVDAKLRELLGLRFGTIETPQQALEALGDLYA